MSSYPTLHTLGKTYTTMRKPCCESSGLKKAACSIKQEYQKHTNYYIQKHAEGSSWPHISESAGIHRCGKSCRLRWMNYVRPEVKRRNFAEDEEDLIIKLHALLGNRWSLIAGRLPGRTDNEVKNHWNSHLKTKLVRMGIDPENHRPRLNGSSGMPCCSACKGFHHKKSGSHDVDQLVSDAESSVASDSSFLSS